MNKVSVVMPAHNEEKRIKGTIINYEKHLKERFKNYEVIVVLNGCKDGTLQVVKELQEKTNKLKFINYEEALGKGGAILEGIKYADGSVIGFVDADDAFSIRGVIKLIEDVQDGADCVIASKWKNQRFIDVTEPFTRKLLSRGWNYLVKIIMGLELKDTQAGAKFFNKDVAESIGNNFIAKDFTFDVELLSRIKQKRYRIKEVFVPSKHVMGGTFKLRHSIPMFINLIKIWWSR